MLLVVVLVFEAFGAFEVFEAFGAFKVFEVFEVFEAFEAFTVFEAFEAFVVFALVTAFDDAALVDLAPFAVVFSADFAFVADDVEDFLAGGAIRSVDCETPVRSEVPDDPTARTPRSSRAGAPCAETAPVGNESPTSDATSIPNFTGP